jgi:hypothetical protein
MFKRAFRTIHKNLPPDFSTQKSEIAQSVVLRQSSGNVNLQSGRFSTADDLDKRRKKICAYDFTI